MTHINGNVRFLKTAAIAGAVAAGMAFGQTAFTDKRDNQSYKSVKIGGQIWMARNLNYNINGSKCYDHNPSNCDKYGKLYNWDAAINACPGGWHLPKDYEWEMLANYIGGDAGKKLKSRGGWAQNGNGTDDYGFSALPGGTGKSDGSFILMGEFGYWWSIGDGADVYYRYISFKDDDLSRYISTKKGSFPVRCVKDNGGTIETAGGSNSSGAVAPKRGGDMFGYVICIAVVVVVFVAIIGIINIQNNVKKSRRREVETEDRVDRAINAVKNTKSKLNDLLLTIKGADAIYVSAKAREQAEEVTTTANRLTEAVENAVSLSIEIIEIRSKRTLAAFEKSAVVSKQAIETAQQLEEEIDAAKVLYGQAMDEELFAKKEETAEKGDATVKYDVSKWYLEEKNDFERYLYWLRKSGEHGYVAAQRELGTMYFEGANPVKQDINEALVWLKKAAGQDGLPPMVGETADWFKLHCDTEKPDFYALILLAIAERRADVMEWLFSLRSNVNVNKKDKDGLSLLHIAALNGSIEVMAFLTGIGANVETKDNSGKTPIFALASAGHTEAMKWLVNKRKANIEARDNRGRTPIFSAVAAGKIECIKCLKEDLNASIFVRDRGSESPLDYAAGIGQIESIKCLNSLGANVNAKRSNGQTPIFSASAFGKTEAIKCLVDLGADINANDEDGKTPMLQAAQAGQVETILCLHELGADINAGDSVGMTPIFAAAGSGKPVCIKCLKDLGADVNAKSKNGMTPIFLAAAEGKLESIDCLIALGADVNVEAQGKTPLALARGGGHSEVAEYLRANGAG